MGIDSAHGQQPTTIKYKAARLALKGGRWSANWAGGVINGMIIF